MPLYDKAVLEFLPYGGASGPGVFEIWAELDDTEEITPAHIMAQRGQYIGEIYDQFSEFTGVFDGLDEGHRRAGYHIDGGAGEDSWALSWESGLDPNDRWGDGSSNSDSITDTTRYDAQGSHPKSKRDILGRWVSQSRADSGGQVLLYIGEYSDGTYADTAGVFDPIPVTVNNARLERSAGDPAVFEGTIELTRTATLPDVESTAEEIVDAVGDIIEDW